MNNLRKFSTEADYSAATLNYPAVSWVTSTDTVHFNKSASAAFSGLTVYYNITGGGSGSGSGSGSGELTPTVLFKGGGGSGSGSGSGSGGALPSAMIIDGTAVEVTNTYQFSTAGEHIVNYSFADNQIPKQFLYGGSEHIFNNVVKITIGDAITSIGIEAFLECYGLTSATIGSGITIIEYSAFQSCSALTSIEIPNSVTSIGNNAFQSCSGLTTCTIGSGVTSIGVGAFGGCSSLTSIDIPNSVTSIGQSAFGSCYSLESISIPDSVTSIDSWIFESCRSLTSIEIPNSVTSIGDYAFTNCSSLTSIKSYATAAPTIQSNTFKNVHTDGTLTVSSGSSGYDVWMGTSNYYLGKYNWSMVEQ